MKELFLLVLFVPASVLVQVHAVQQQGYYQHQQPQYNAVPVPTYRNQHASQGYLTHQDVPANHRTQALSPAQIHSQLSAQAKEAFASARKPQQAYYRPIPAVPVHVQPAAAAAGHPRQVSVPQVVTPQPQQYRPQPQEYRPQPQEYRPQAQEYRPQAQEYRPQPQEYRPPPPQQYHHPTPVQSQYRVSQAPQYSLHQQKKHQDDEEEKYSPPNPYAFGFDVQDDHYTNYQNRKEQSDGKKITGSYSVVDSDGFLRTVQYTADPKEGFKAEVTRQPTDIKVKIPKPLPQFQTQQKYAHQDPQQYLQEVPVQRGEHHQQQPEYQQY
ncbi:unnamed protein product [Acanthoscelides obtectus]|uniref:Uncharacterized protein n=1 Tax=Acanthoscelides obtectus TaxID=200917 RepID=A0A9P0PWK5_ACAOB|nr:unnamed protein product [Acanthoscelides obtectus]CAK1668605.1 hypothetical protein AOBTE_LOCUS26509 [Acanthoscelides obtectus]